MSKPLTDTFFDRWKTGNDKLEEMYLRHKKGETYQDYGLEPVANAVGWTSGSAGLSDGGQIAVNSIEKNWAYNITQSIGVAWFGVYGAVFYGYEQFDLTHIRMEKTRAKYILAKMEQIYREECWCSLQRIKDL
jgi:hypothetical protein